MQFNGPWEPIETLPWETDPDFDEDSNFHWRLPVGIALRRPDLTEHVLIGDDIAGHRSSGCDCCSTSWREKIVNFDGWQWIVRPE